MYVYINIYIYMNPVPGLPPPMVWSLPGWGGLAHIIHVTIWLYISRLEYILYVYVRIIRMFCTIKKNWRDKCSETFISCWQIQVIFHHCKEHHWGAHNPEQPTEVCSSAAVGKIVRGRLLQDVFAGFCAVSLLDFPKNWRFPANSPHWIIWWKLMW